MYISAFFQKFIVYRIQSLNLSNFDTYDTFSLLNICESHCKCLARVRDFVFVCVRSFPKSHIFQLLISLLAFHFHMTGCALESNRRAVQWVPDRIFGPCLLVDIGKLKQIVLPKVMPVIDA